MLSFAFRFNLFSEILQRARLSAQTQSAYNLVVTLDVSLLQVIKQTASLRDHLQQAAPRVIVLLMRLEMLSEIVDALA